MDGPQIDRRWSSRYATVLAEDPGSSVLTLTSLGLISRSATPGEPALREIGLWKQPDGPVRRLQLPRGSHAMLLTLTPTETEGFTMDGRSDTGTTFRFDLTGVHAITSPESPKWANST